MDSKSVMIDQFLSIPKVENAVNNSDIHLFIIGLRNCPHSEKSIRLAQSEYLPNETINNPFHKRHDSGWLNRSKKDKFRELTRYDDTFPIVFIRDSEGVMKHVGGCSELEYILNKMIEWFY